MWAPLTPPATQMAKATAIAQPQVISSQSPAALKIVVGPAVRPEPGSPATATATTPSPNEIRTNIPMNSAMSSPHSPVMRPTVRPSPRSGVMSSAMMSSCPRHASLRAEPAVSAKVRLGAIIGNGPSE